LPFRLVAITPLDGDQLKQLVEGKTLKVRNTVTQQEFDVLFGLDGKRTITELNGALPKPGDLFQSLHTNVSGSSASYEIRDGRIVTTVEGTPFELTVYKSGDKFVAARSNEFGYANYEVLSVEQ